MNRHAIIEKCRKLAEDAIYEANQNDACEASASFSTPNGSFELWCVARGEPWEVFIDNSTAHPLPRLHKEILAVMPPFEQVEEEDDEENYTNLDPAFSSWDDVRGMSFVAY